MAASVKIHLATANVSSTALTANNNYEPSNTNIHCDISSPIIEQTPAEAAAHHRSHVMGIYHARIRGDG